MNMKRMIQLLGLMLLADVLPAQVARDYAVLLQAEVSASPVQITLRWNRDATCTGQIVLRKAKDENDWIQLATPAVGDSVYTDNSISAGTAYEYYVRRSYSGRVAHGYILSGINMPEAHKRGKLLLLVDGNYVLPIAAEITQLKKDLAGDGWQLKTMVIARNETVKNIKTKILTELLTYSGTKAIYILGHVPVPYSGQLNPDAHPDHIGAWPADVYYGTLDETAWRDQDVNDTSASRAANRNVPGDGKFDLTQLYPTNIDVQVGRVDLFNMPQLGSTDTILMRNYLNKAHQFKFKLFEPVNRAIIDDNFGAFSGEAFAASGWRSFAPIVGNNVSSGDYFGSVKQGSYLLAYGCGAGSYTSCSGVGNTSNFKNDSIHSVFNMFFGSYFGDWDNTNNFLRAPLGSMPMSLTSVWSGRPHWVMHQMALGENIGYSALRSQNNFYIYNTSVKTGYWSSNFANLVHMALMGDPSLRAKYISPVPSVSIQKLSNPQVKVTWTASTESGVTHYNVYRSTGFESEFEFLAKINAGTTEFTDANPKNGLNVYMVRAVVLQQSFSGTYNNQSIGIMDTVSVSNPTNSLAETSVQLGVELYPNPARDYIMVAITGNARQKNVVQLCDLTGKIIKEKELEAAAGFMDMNDVSGGVYIVKINSGTQVAFRKLVVGK